MLQLPHNQEPMKEHDRLKQKSIMMMSNIEAKQHIQSPAPWITCICRQSEITDKSTQFRVFTLTLLKDISHKLKETLVNLKLHLIC